MGREQDSSNVQDAHSAKCSADRRMLERGLSFLAARKVAKMTKDPSTLGLGEYELKTIRMFLKG